MVNLKGFKAHLLDPEYVTQVPIETEDLFAMSSEQTKPVPFNSFRKVHQPECDFEDHVARDKSNMSNVLARGKTNLLDFLNRRIFAKSAHEVGYLYRQVYNGREQCGLLFAVQDQDYVNGKLLPHEQTFEDKVSRLSEGADVLGVYNSFPLAFCDSDEFLDSVIEFAKADKPIYFLRQNNVEHYLYAFDENMSQQIIDAFKRYGEIYIADGHHRLECYSKLVAKLHKSPDRPLHDDYDYYPLLIYPKNNLKAYSYYRLVKGLDNINVDDVLDKSTKYFRIKQRYIAHKPGSEVYDAELLKLVKPYNKGRFLVYFKARRAWYEFKALPYKPSNPIEGLDISYLSTNLLTKVLHVDDLKSSNSLEYVPENKYTIAELERHVAADESTSIIVVCPRTSLDEVKSVADARTCMPPKSTFVFPKPLIGLLFKDFEAL